mgnify:CR=1 FL=1
MQIIGVGDIMPGGLLTYSGNPCANETIIKYLLQGDLRCGTLECALGNEPTYDRVKVTERGNVIYAKDADIRRLKELHIDVVSLANNHFFDLGTEGAKHTIELLDKEGISHCGAGQNLKEAGKPVVMDVQGKKVAFLAFCDTEYNHVFMCTYATYNSPGINPMHEDYVVNEIKKNVALYDYVVVLAHWGTEHTFDPNLSIVKMAKMMMKAGAAAVLGSHPHRIQPVINTRKGSIVYSMGNFLFPERLIAPPKVTYYPDAPIDYSKLPVTNEYPIVDCVTLKTLPFLARVGMIVTTEIDGKRVHSSYVFSYLNHNNCLEFLDGTQSIKLHRTIQKLSFVMKNHLYRCYLGYNIYKNAILRKLKIVINRQR